MSGGCLKFSLLFVVLLSLLLGACANNVLLNATHSYTGDNSFDNMDITVHQQDVLISKDTPLSSMTFVLSDEVQNKLNELTGRGFSQDQFTQTIKAGLINAGLLNEASNSGLKLELTLQNAFILSSAGSFVLAIQNVPGMDLARYNYSKISAIIRDAKGNIVANYVYFRYSECDMCDAQHRAQNVYDIATAETIRAISVKGH
jgi:hypothetical protein